MRFWLARAGLHPPADDGGDGAGAGVVSICGMWVEVDLLFMPSMTPLSRVCCLGSAICKTPKFRVKYVITMSNQFLLIERPPTTEEYLRLRETVGWGDMDAEATGVGLSTSLFSVCVLFGDEVVGCGRVIGDGGIYFYIQDVIVSPELQGQGIGELIMNALMKYLKAHAHANAFIGLMAAKGRAGFYKRFGFSERPSGAPGMYMVME
jgi:ribosomal protein S18 acetylase RimI-like enzyme